MAPFAKTGEKLKDDFKTLAALRHGCYEVDVGKTINKMVKRSLKEGQILVSIITENPDVEEVSDIILTDQEEIDYLLCDIECEIADAEEYGVIMDDTAKYTKWRLKCEAVMISIFIGVCALLLAFELKYAAVVGFSTVAFLVFLFMDTLDRRAKELNEQFDYLRSICMRASDDLVEYAVRSNHYNYLLSIFEERFNE